MTKWIKRVAVATVFIICGLFIIRCFMVADKSTFAKPANTEAMQAAYADGQSVTYAVDVQKEIADDGYFSAYGFYYTPESGEVQLAVRWNDSVYDYTAMTPGHEFSFYLLNETTGEKYPARAVEEAKKSIYNYRRLVAEGVLLEEDQAMVVVMELRDGFTSRQLLKDARQGWEEYRISFEK